MSNKLGTKLGAALTGLGTAAALLVGVSGPVGADTITVHKGESIQAAIDAASPGSVVSVETGTYEENVWITKDGITLRAAAGAVPNIKAPATNAPATPPGCINPEDPGEFTGVCVLGVTGVRVTGLTVRQFGVGILVLAATGTLVDNNMLIGNDGYGVFALASTGTQIRANSATKSREAGIYVGDSPEAQATVQANTAFDNGFGIFIRSASKGDIVNNDLHDNCVGLLFLDEPHPATHWLAKNNTVSNNNRSHGCDFTGIGIAAVGGRNLTIRDNAVNDNHAPGFPGGGVVVVSERPDHPSTNIDVLRNSAHNNTPADLVWDGGGSVTFTNNACATSIPPGLCH